MIIYIGKIKGGIMAYTPIQEDDTGGTIRANLNNSMSELYTMAGQIPVLASQVTALETLVNTLATQIAALEGKHSKFDAYQQNFAYAVADTVRINAGYYICKTAHTSPATGFTAANWVQVQVQ